MTNNTEGAKLQGSISALELYNRIELTIENPPCVIDNNLRNQYCWYDREVEIVIGCPGVAVSCVGYRLESSSWLDRNFRAEKIGLEWSYLLHFEQAMNFLFCGRTHKYNEIARMISLPLAKTSILIPFFGEFNEQEFLTKLKSALCGDSTTTKN